MITPPPSLLIQTNQPTGTVHWFWYFDLVFCCVIFVLVLFAFGGVGGEECLFKEKTTN